MNGTRETDHDSPLMRGSLLSSCGSNRLDLSYAPVAYAVHLEHADASELIFI